MSIAKRILFFLVVNFLVVVTITFILNLLNVAPYLRSYGLDYESLLIFCSIWGMGGAFISLLLSKPMAKWMMGVKIIDETKTSQDEQNLLQMVENIARDAGLDKTPDVGIFQSDEVNAFATGATKNSALVAVSSGLLRSMDEDELKAVLGHEISHISSGDMVTMTLLQGVANAFVMFLARVLGFVLASSGKGKDSRPNYFSYHMFVYLFEILFMVLASIPIAAFSRYREFRADANSARHVGKERMIAALKKLILCQNRQDPALENRAINAFKISSKGGLIKLFATHPPLEDRIARLEQDG